MMIGGINIFVGILQTMTQFMKVNEMVSEHRIAAISFDKLSRNIIAELSLPENERSYSGKDFVHFCRKEMDRIIEQSPVIPEHILCNLEKIIKSDTITNNQNRIVGFVGLDTKFGIDDIYKNSNRVNDISESDYIKINIQQMKDAVIKKTLEKAKTIEQNVIGSSLERGTSMDSATFNKSSAEVIPKESHNQNVSISMQEEIGIIEPIEDNV
jgi:hypothetical protein